MKRQGRCSAWGAFLGILLGWVSPTFALEGRVLLPEGSPASDVTVSIVGHPGSTRTDGEGRFVWLPDPPLPFQILVLLPDGRYAPPVFVEQVPAEEPVIVRTQPALVETVTVTTGAAPHIEAPPAAGLRSLVRQEIEQRHSLRLADLLEDVPGVGRIDEGHSAVPSIRGLARGRTLVLLDGARVTAERRAGPSATFLDPFFLEEVEVSRGPGSVAYGSDALGGVIDARTKRPEPGSPLRLRFKGSLANGLPERSAGLEIARGLNEGGLLFQARARKFENYQSPAGEVFDSGASDRGVLLRANHEAGPGVLSIALQTDVGRDIGKPSADAQACLEAPGSCATSSRTFYPVEDSHRLTVSYDLFPRQGFRQIGLNGFLGSYRLILRRDLLAQALDPLPLSIADVAARDFGLRAFAERPAGRGGLRLGLDLNGRYGLEARSTESAYDASGTLLSETAEEPIENASRIDSALYVSAEAPLGRVLTAAGGLRLDRVATRNRGGFFGDRRTAHGTVAGFGALTATFLPGLSATAQIARGFRDPTLSDRYFVGPTGRGRVTGNPGLDPETSLQADLAVRYTRSAFRCALYLYDYRIEDLVERFEPDPASAPDRFAFRNRGLARLRGVELEIQGETARGLSVLFGAEVASGRALDDDSPLADVPPAGVTLTLRQTIQKRGYLMARAAAHSRDDNAGPTEATAVPGHTVFDLGGGWRLGPAAELRLLLRNVADKEYPGTSDEKSVLAPGRTGLATLVIDF